MQAVVLDSENDRHRWDDIVAGFPPDLRDVYYRPSWLDMNRLDAECRALAFVARNGSHLWLYPFLQRPIQSVGSVRLRPPCCDLETPQGYGGPLSNTDDRRFLQAAHGRFRAWSREAGVIAEFVRFHPFYGNERWADSSVDVHRDRETVSIRLKGFDPDSPPYPKKTLNMMRRAERLGITVRLCDSPEDFRTFRELYRANMRRIGAAAEYQYNAAYFAGLETLVRDRGWLLAAEKDGRWAAGAVFLRGETLLHYHLSASDEHRVPGATNLLLHSAASLGADCHLERLHLGGGTSADANDTLLRFKATMATERHTFRIGRRVHDAARYRQVCDSWRREFPHLTDTYGHRLLCYRNTSS